MKIGTLERVETKLIMWEMQKNFLKKLKSFETLHWLINFITYRLFILILSCNVEILWNVVNLVFYNQDKLVDSIRFGLFQDCSWSWLEWLMNVWD